MVEQHIVFYDDQSEYWYFEGEFEDDWCGPYDTEDDADQGREQYIRHKNKLVATGE